MSYAEAEYVSLSACCAQVISMRTQLLDYGFHYHKIPIYCDSKSAIAISCNPVQHSRTKHINIRYHFIKEHVEKGTIELYFVGTEYQLADLLSEMRSEQSTDHLDIVCKIMFCLIAEIRETDDFKDYETVFMKVVVPTGNVLVSVYTTGNVLVRGMLIPDAFLTTEIRETNDFKEYETVFMKVVIPMNQPQPVVSTQGMHRITPSAHRSPTVYASPPKSKKRKQITGESNSPKNHKDNPELVDDDDDKEREKKDDEMGSLEIRNEEMRTTIPTPLGALHRMCRRQGYMIQDMERKCVTAVKFWETHNKIDDILHEVVSQIAENVTNDLIEANLKPCIVNTIIEDRDAFRSEVPAFLYKEFKAHAPEIIEELFKNHMKRNLQDRADDISLWEALRRKFEKSSTSNTSCREDDFHSHHDKHQDYDAPP
ncbi:hypothetical protein Tco_1050422 [Tanacetum coccineum]